MTAEQDKQREIDRLHATIDQECQTLNAGLQGLTGAARHTFVSERMKIIGTYADELAALVGTQAEALAFVLERLSNWRAGNDAPPTFLQVGNTMIAIAYMTMVSQVGDDTVSITVVDGAMDITFEGDEAQRFLELFQAHCRIISE